MTMPAYRRAVLACMVLIVAVLVSLHSPGQISVDSGVALYEGLAGRAIGWGPPFFAAVLSWLGGGVIGAGIFVALNTLALYACFAALLTGGIVQRLAPWWRIAIATVLVLNPLFAFYAGIVWKDVMLATCTVLALTLTLLAAGRPGRARWVLLGFAILAIAPMPLLRQQGILLAAPLLFAAVWVAVRHLRMALAGRMLSGAGIVVLALAANLAMGWLSAATIRPLPASPVSVGVLTIQAYDIAGMMAYALPSDRSEWSAADAPTRQQVRYYYSAERIDTVWHDPLFRNYINGLGDKGVGRTWREGVRHDPVAYASHRVAAFASLLGFGPVRGCVPAYWGVAIPPEYLEPLSLREEMDPRDRLIGQSAKALYRSPVFRHWWYAGMLLLATIAAVRRREADAWPLRAAVAAGWIYLASFAPTTIACDFRYLFPVACIATVSSVWMLVRPGSRNQTLMSDGSTRNTGTSARAPA